MAFYSVETKWNADDQKLHMLMEIEAELEEGFLEKDHQKIWDFLGAYRRHSLSKFRITEQKEINSLFEELKEKYNNFLENKYVENFNSFYSFAEGLFLAISQKIKEAGIYYREGRDARHAVLER
jgi:hypothetical protein